MSLLTAIDLRQDPAAGRYLKDEVVQVSFAEHAGELASLEGPNRYQPGDALVTGSTGDHWVVARSRFDERYLPTTSTLTHGQPGAYRNRPAQVLERRMDRPFQLARSQGGDVLSGAAGDWVLQYAPGDYGVVQAARFARVYRPVD